MIARSGDTSGCSSLSWQLIALEDITVGSELLHFYGPGYAELRTYPVGDISAVAQYWLKA
jgi:hypothetical protein